MQRLCGGDMGEGDPGPGVEITMASVTINLAAQKCVPRRPSQGGRWMWFGESGERCGVTRMGGAQVKSCGRKGCDCVDRSACFPANNSENLRLFFVPVQPGQGLGVVNEQGRVVFWFSAPCVTQRVHQVLQTRARFYASPFPIVPKTQGFFLPPHSQ